MRRRRRLVICLALAVDLCFCTYVNVSFFPASVTYVGGSLAVRCEMTSIVSPASVSIVRTAGPAARCIVGGDYSPDVNDTSDNDYHLSNYPVAQDNAPDAGSGSEPSQDDWWTVTHAVGDAANATWPPAAEAFSDGCGRLAGLRRKQRAMVVFSAVGGASDEMAGQYRCKVTANSAGLGVGASSAFALVVVKSTPDEPALLPEPLTFKNGQVGNITCSRLLPRQCDLATLTFRCGGDAHCPSRALVKWSPMGLPFSWFSFKATPSWHGVTVTCNVSCKGSTSAWHLGHVSINYLIIRNDSIVDSLSSCEQPAATYRLCNPENKVVLTCLPFVESQPPALYRWHGRMSNGTLLPLQGWTTDGRVVLLASTGSPGTRADYVCLIRNSALAKQLLVDVEILWKDYNSGDRVSSLSILEQVDPQVIGIVAATLGGLGLALAGASYFAYRRKLWCFHASPDNADFMVTLGNTTVVTKPAAPAVRLDCPTDNTPLARSEIKPTASLASKPAAEAASKPVDLSASKPAGQPGNTKTPPAGTPDASPARKPAVSPAGKSAAPFTAI